MKDRFTDPIESLVRRAQRGDREAFDELGQRSREALLRWIQSQMSPHLRSRVEPEDILQETLVWAYRSIERLEWRGEDALRRWLFSIAKHVVLKQAARRDGTRERFLECDPPAPEPSPSRAMRRNERFERLGAALQSLSPNHRRVVELARLRGMPIQEIARLMGRSPEAISQLLSRALKKLRETIGDTESLGLPDRLLEPGGGDDA